MQIHKLQFSTRKVKRRIGRGGKRGTYSGRGVKGQKARAGRRIRPELRDTLKKIHKKRGYSNQPIRRKPVAVTISKLERLFDVNVLVTPKLLRSRLDVRGAVIFKVMGSTKMHKKLSIKGISVSSGAKRAIEAVGGSVSD